MQIRLTCLLIGILFFCLDCHAQVAPPRELALTCTSKVIAHKPLFSGASAHHDHIHNRVLILGAGENKYHENGKFAGWGFEQSILTCLPQSSSIGFKKMKIAPGKPQPVARSYISAASQVKKGAILMFGGFNPEFLSDFWRYDLSRASWSEIQRSPDAAWPDQRDAHSTCVDESTGDFYLFGGLNKNGPRNDLWIWRAKSESWTEVKPASKTTPWPIPRLTHRMIAIPGAKALVFGGLNVKFQSLNELWLLDLKTRAFKKLPSAPMDLAGAALVWHPKLKKLLVLGGSQKMKAQDVVLAFDPKSETWSKVGSLAGPIAHATALYDATQDRVLLFGGTIGVFMAQHPKHMVQEVKVFLAPASKPAKAANRDGKPEKKLGDKNGSKGGGETHDLSIHP